MTDEDKSKEQLIEELAALRQRVKTLEAAEEELAKSRAILKAANESLDIFRRFAEASGEGLGMSDFDGRIVYANPALCRIFGEEKPENIVGKSVSSYYPAKYVQWRKDELIPTLLRNGNCHSEQAVLPRQGKPVQTLQSTFLIRDENANPVRIAVVISDITQRKNAEEALRASEELFRVAFEEAPVGMIIAADGVITKVNRALCRMSGFAPEEIVGHLALEFTNSEDRDMTKAFLRRLLAGASPSFTVEKRYLKKDGEFYWGRATAAAVRDGKGQVAFILAIVEDVTERKATREALQQSHDELRAIYEGMADGMHILSLTTLKPLRANPALCRMMGYSLEEVLQLSPEDVHPPEELPRILRDFKAFLEGRNSGAFDVPLIRKDGRVIYVDITGSRIAYHGTPCVACFFHDVTERKKAQEVLAKQHRTLKHLLHSSDHERQLIAYEIHDGLAQHLAASLMQFQTYQATKGTQPKAAAKMLEAGIVMLQQSHKEARRLIAGVRPPILDESGVIEAIGHLVNELRRQKGPQIEFLNLIDFDRLVPVLENAIYRICQEALANACRHSQSVKVRISLLQQKDRLRMEIRDWGVGFNIKDVPERHFGLEGIRQRTRLLGGKCSIRSKPGKGTRLVVELPVVERDQSE